MSNHTKRGLVLLFLVCTVFLLMVVYNFSMNNASITGNVVEAVTIIGLLIIYC